MVLCTQRFGRERLIALFSEELCFLEGKEAERMQKSQHATFSSTKASRQCNDEK
jgi:hypothetical protein